MDEIVVNVNVLCAHMKFIIVVKIRFSIDFGPEISNPQNFLCSVSVSDVFSFSWQGGDYIGFFKLNWLLWLQILGSILKSSGDQLVVIVSVSIYKNFCVVATKCKPTFSHGVYIWNQVF